jgi:hypothetical protein
MLASVGFSFSMTELGLGVIAFLVFGMSATFKFRQAPNDLSRREALLWRLAPTIGFLGGAIGLVILFGILMSIKHHWHTYSWLSAVEVFAGISLSIGLRRLVEKSVK